MSFALPKWTHKALTAVLTLHNKISVITRSTSQFLPEMVSNDSSLAAYWMALCTRIECKLLDQNLVISRSFTFQLDSSVCVNGNRLKL